MAEDIVDEMFEDFLETESESAAKQALEQARLAREAKIAEFRRASNLRKMGQIFKKWAKFARKQRIQAEILNSFPSAPTNLKVTIIKI